MTKPLVTIQILNWNRKLETCRAIESALNQSYTNVEVVVVDNGSDDGSVEHIANKYPNLLIVPLDRNFGCPGGRNRGIEFCQGEFIFYLDNDGVLHQDAVKNALTVFAENPSIAVVTGVVKTFEKISEIDTACDLENSIYETSAFDGGISMHRASIYKKTGFFPDDYFYGGEETFMSYRILDANLSVFYSSNVLLWHKRSSLARNRKKELLSIWTNSLVTSYQLYPLEYAVLYVMYFFVIYPYYAYREGIFSDYWIQVPKVLQRLKTSSRRPISRKAYRRFQKLKYS